MAQNYPYEYQAIFAQADEKERLARQLAQLVQAQRPGAGRMVGKFYVAPHPLQHIAHILSQWNVERRLGEAQKLRQDAFQRMAAAEEAERARIAEILSGRKAPGPQAPEPQTVPGPQTVPEPQTSIPGDPIAAARAALASRFPGVQRYGEQLRQLLSSQFSAMAPHATPESVIRSQGDPTRLSPQLPERWSDLQNVAPPGAPATYASREERTGKHQFAPVPSQHTVNVGDKGAVSLLQTAFGRVASQERQQTVTAARKTLDAGTAAWNLLATTPLNLGLDSDIKTFAQGLSRIVGVEVPANVPATQLYNSFIMPMIGEVIRMFGAGTAISDSDRKAAEAALAKATNDPRMIEVALGYAIRGAYKEMMGYENELRNLATYADQIGVPSSLMTGMIPKYGFSVPPGRRFPDNWIEPGVLERWATETILGKPRVPPGKASERRYRVSPEAEEVIKRWLPR